MTIDFQNMKHQKELENMTIEEYMQLHPELNLNTLEASLNNLQEATDLFHKTFGDAPSPNDSSFVAAIREKEKLDMAAVSREIGRYIGFDLPPENSYELKHDQREFEKYQSLL